MRVYTDQAMGVVLGNRLLREEAHSALARQCFPQRGVGVVSREHCYTVSAQCFNHRAVFPGYRLHRMHEFEVLALSVVHQCHGGLRHLGQ